MVSFAFLPSSLGSAAGVGWLVNGRRRFGPVSGLPKLVFRCLKNSMPMTLSLAPENERTSQMIPVRLLETETFHLCTSG